MCLTCDTLTTTQTTHVRRAPNRYTGHAEQSSPFPLRCLKGPARAQRLTTERSHLRPSTRSTSAVPLVPSAHPPTARHRCHLRNIAPTNLPATLQLEARRCRAAEQHPCESLKPPLEARVQHRTPRRKTVTNISPTFAARYRLIPGLARFRAFPHDARIMLKHYVRGSSGCADQYGCVRAIQSGADKSCLGRKRSQRRLVCISPFW
jgi:hypothetical protein